MVILYTNPSAFDFFAVPLRGLVTSEMVESTWASGYGDISHDVTAWTLLNTINKLDKLGKPV